jgi:fructose-bisphosphate aldolase class II
MKTLREAIADAEAKKVAIGHFNISNLEMFWGIFHAALSINVPVIIGISEGEREFIGVAQAVALIKSVREQYNYPIFLNADHTYSFEKVKQAIDAGFDSVIYDGAKGSYEDNVKVTKQCVEYAKGKRSASGAPILVEAELGYIGQSSRILDGIPEGVDLQAGLTKPEQAKEFVEATGIDLFAPAVGNIHGMMRVGNDPALDIARIADIRKTAGVPLVLHGGSGTTDQDFVRGVEAGLGVVHISTELRVAFVNGLRKSLEDNPDEVAPYKYLKTPVQEVEKVALARLKLFNKIA